MGEPALSYHDAIERLATVEPHPGKTCGTCTACCSVVPVREVGTKSYQRCPLLRAPPDFMVGCSIYDHRPRGCRVWACHWLASDWEDDLRPDRCGVIADTVPDVVGVMDNATGKVTETPAVQLWALRGHEDAWRSDPVHAVILAILAEGMIALWRLPPDAQGRQMAIAFHKDPVTGRVSRGPIQPATRREPSAHARQVLRLHGAMNKAPPRGIEIDHHGRVIVRDHGI